MPNNCKWCDIKFENIQELRKHLKVDSEKHMYYCQRCKFTFKSFRALKEHFERTSRHRKKDADEMMTEQNAYCLHCRRQFPTSVQLLHHFSTTHRFEQLCTTCDLWFRFNSNLNQHSASRVHDERNLPCPHCAKPFKSASGVAHHLEFTCLKKITNTVVKWDTDHEITDRLYTDRIQEVASDDEDDYILVMRTHSGAQEIIDIQATEDAWDAIVQAYVCPIVDCRKEFAKIGHLDAHLQSPRHRTDPTTFHCPRCESRFPVISALVQHLESESCGLAAPSMVKDIYIGLYDTFQKLLKF